MEFEIVYLPLVIFLPFLNGQGQIHLFASGLNASLSELINFIISLVKIIKTLFYPYIYIHSSSPALVSFFFGSYAHKLENFFEKFSTEFNLTEPDF